MRKIICTALGASLVMWTVGCNTKSTPAKPLKLQNQNAALNGVKAKTGKKGALTLPPVPNPPAG